MKSRYSKTSYSQSTLTKAKELAKLKQQFRAEKGKKAEAIKQQIVTFINRISYSEMEVVSAILDKYEEEWNRE